MPAVPATQAAPTPAPPRFGTRREAAVLLRKGEEQSGDYTHPDSYAIPTMPGGSKFMRNPPPPLQAVFPDGIPEEADIAPQTLEGIQVPMSATPEGYDKILVFPYSKSAQ